jgi:hypothetical protein
MTALTSRGKRLWDMLRASLRDYQNGPEADETSRPIIRGISPTGNCVGGTTLSSALAQARRILTESERVYRWEDSICFEFDDPGGRRLAVLASQGKAESHAPSVLANLFCTAVEGQDSRTESVPAPKFVGAVLADEVLLRQLQAIRTYARRPVFDEGFRLCGSGWSPESGILVHGPDFEPEEEAPAWGPQTPALDRLPPLLRQLLGGFCWQSDADLANAVGLFLTGLLANHFIDDPKPIGIFDGNQRCVGKALLCQVLGRVLDGVEPARILLDRDEELAKRLGAQLRDARSSVFLFDNVRSRIESTVIEQNALSPELRFRNLGSSTTIQRRNSYLWLITSNLTLGTEDLISRSIPVRLRYEGNPRDRQFEGDPLELASRSRVRILGELAGMVLRWLQAGKPLASPRHRCRRWSQVIGGILSVAGLDQFLTNVEEAEAAIDEGLQALATLAERLFEKKASPYYALPREDTNQRGKPPREWVSLFVEGELLVSQLANRNAQGQSTCVGNFLSAKVGREVTVETSRGVYTATLRARPGRGHQKLYYFEMLPVAEGSESAPTAPGDIATPVQDPLIVDKGSEVTMPLTNPAVSTAPPPVPAAGQAGTRPPGGEAPERGNNLEWS